VPQINALINDTENERKKAFREIFNRSTLNTADEIKNLPKEVLTQLLLACENYAKLLLEKVFCILNEKNQANSSNSANVRYIASVNALDIVKKNPTGKAVYEFVQKILGNLCNCGQPTCEKCTSVNQFLNHQEKITNRGKKATISHVELLAIVGSISQDAAYEYSSGLYTLGFLLLGDPICDTAQLLANFLINHHAELSSYEEYFAIMNNFAKSLPAITDFLKKKQEPNK
jgi:hypothetical protein